jgi:hypothetical protein
MKFLDRDRDGPDAKYFNAPAPFLSLDRHSPRYIGPSRAAFNVPAWRRHMSAAAWLTYAAKRRKDSQRGSMAESNKAVTKPYLPVR